MVDAPLPISAHELFDLLFGCDSAFMVAYWAAEVRRPQGSWRCLAEPRHLLIAPLMH